MATPKTNFILSNGKLVPAYPASSVMISSSSDLSSNALKELPPSSIAYTAGWNDVWQKKTDGTWEKL